MFESQVGNPARWPFTGCVVWGTLVGISEPVSASVMWGPYYLSFRVVVRIK